MSYVPWCCLHLFSETKEIPDPLRPEVLELFRPSFHPPVTMLAAMWDLPSLTTALKQVTSFKELHDTRTRTGYKSNEWIDTIPRVGTSVSAASGKGDDIQGCRTGSSCQNEAFVMGLFLAWQTPRTYRHMSGVPWFWPFLLSICHLLPFCSIDRTPENPLLIPQRNPPQPSPSTTGLWGTQSNESWRHQ